MTTVVTVLGVVVVVSAALVGLILWAADRKQQKGIR